MGTEGVVKEGRQHAIFASNVGSSNAHVSHNEVSLQIRTINISVLVFPHNGASEVSKTTKCGYGARGFGMNDRR